MAKKSFSTTWKSSTQPRKQRKYIYNAPLHIKQNQLHAHLSKDLRSKYGSRNLLVRKGDKVRIMRGQFAKAEGKVEKISIKYGKVFVAGVELIKKDGSKTQYPLNPSNLMIIDLDLSDKVRKSKIESKLKNDTKSVKSVKKENKVEDKQ